MAPRRRPGPRRHRRGAGRPRRRGSGRARLLRRRPPLLAHQRARRERQRPERHLAGECLHLRRAHRLSGSGTTSASRASSRSCRRRAGRATPTSSSSAGAPTQSSRSSTGRSRPSSSPASAARRSPRRSRTVLHEDTDLVPQGGVGARIAVAPSWGFRLDARILIPPSTEGTGSTVDWELLGGLYATFGAKKPAPPRARARGAGARSDQGHRRRRHPRRRRQVPDRARGQGRLRGRRRLPRPRQRQRRHPRQGRQVSRTSRRPRTATRTRTAAPTPCRRRPRRRRRALDGVTFATGKATIAEELRLGARRRGARHEGDSPMKVEIAGHTDDVGNHDAN